MNTYRIAVIAGDGIGKEVVPEGLRVLDAVATKFDLTFEWESFDWSCAYYLAHGAMMPDDWRARANFTSRRYSKTRIP